MRDVQESRCIENEEQADQAQDDGKNAQENRSQFGHEFAFLVLFGVD